jgi:hypothetical protein
MVLGFFKSKLTMFRAHCPFNPLDQLAESKVINKDQKYQGALLTLLLKRRAFAILTHCVDPGVK